MRYFPVNLDLQGREVVVIGAGEVGLRKIETLLEAGAKVKVYDPKPLPELQKMKVRLVRRAYRLGDLGQAFAAIAATDDRKVNRAIHAEAKRKKILLNIVDKPEFCGFVFPARVSRGEFLVTVSTGGGSPALSKKVREDLEKIFGPEYGELVKLLGKIRKRFDPASLKGMQKAFTDFVRSPILSLLKKRDQKGIDRLVQQYFKT